VVTATSAVATIPFTVRVAAGSDFMMHVPHSCADYLIERVWSTSTPLRPRVVKKVLPKRGEAQGPVGASGNMVEKFQKGFQPLTPSNAAVVVTGVMDGEIIANYRTLLHRFCNVGSAVTPVSNFNTALLYLDQWFDEPISSNLVTIGAAFRNYRGSLIYRAIPQWQQAYTNTDSGQRYDSVTTSAPSFMSRQHNWGPPVRAEALASTEGGIWSAAGENYNTGHFPYVSLYRHRNIRSSTYTDKAGGPSFTTATPNDLINFGWYFSLQYYTQSLPYQLTQAAGDDFVFAVPTWPGLARYIGDVVTFPPV
jgi:hypothetical protein